MTELAAMTALRTETARCAHDSLLSLGSGGNVIYLQCESCGAVLLREGGGMWLLPRSPQV